MTANQIAFYKAKNEKKHYERQDAESARHNVATESISTESNLIQKWYNEQQAKHLERSDSINMAHYERMDAETKRHNQEQERLTEQANRIDYLEYLNDKDVNAAKVGIQEREVAVKEGQLQIDEQKLPFILDQYTSETGLNKAKTEESKSKSAYNKVASAEKKTQAYLHLVEIVTKPVETVTKVADEVRKWVPIIGLQ